MAYDEGLRVAAVQILEECPEGSLLLGCAGVGGLTADVLSRDAYQHSQEIGMYLQYNFNATRSKYKGTGAGNAEKSRL